MFSTSKHIVVISVHIRPYIAFYAHFALHPHNSANLDAVSEVEEHKSAHIDPGTSCDSLHQMLDSAPVPCLVVPCMKAVLKDGRLDVVPFPAFLGRYCLDFLLCLGAFHRIRVEISPGYRSVLIRYTDFPFVSVSCEGCRNDFSGVCVGYREGAVFIHVESVARLSALDAVGHEPEAVVKVFAPAGGEPAVVLALIGAVGMKLPDIVAGHFLRALDRVLDKGVVGGVDLVDLNVRDERRPAGRSSR